MHRIAPILFVGGLLLLLTSLRAPASPTSTARPEHVAFFDAQSSVVLTAVSEEVARLQKRRTEPARAPVPSRDPFAFGAEPAEPAASVPNLTPTVEAPPPPEPVVPRLVAIAEAEASGAQQRRAFIAVAGGVLEVEPGDTVGRFVVETVGVTTIEMRDTVSGTTYTVVLR